MSMNMVINYGRLYNYFSTSFLLFMVAYVSYPIRIIKNIYFSQIISNKTWLQKTPWNYDRRPRFRRFFFWRLQGHKNIVHSLWLSEQCHKFLHFSFNNYTFSFGRNLYTETFGTSMARPFSPVWAFVTIFFCNIYYQCNRFN